MKVFHFKICDKTMNRKSRKRHNKTKRHYFLKIYVANTYNYNDVFLDDVEEILHENIISHNKKFIEIKIYVSCKINDDVEIKVYKDEHDLCVVIPPFGEARLYVYVAEKMICNNIRENLSSRYDINCTSDMKIKNLTIKFVSCYDNMTYRYYMQQPRQMMETKMVKHVKNMSEEEIDNYNFLTYKHRLSLL